MTNFKFVRIVYLLIFVLFTTSLCAFNIDVDILSKYYKPTPVLISNLYSDDDTKEYADDITSSLRNVLEDSGTILPRVIGEDFLSDYVENNDIDFRNISLDLSNYEYYQYTVVGKLLLREDSQYVLEIAIFDNTSVSPIKKFGYRLKKEDLANNLQNIVHNIANEIYQLCNNTRGYFEDNLIYAQDNSIMIADYLGRNSKKLLTAKGEIYSPVISRNNKNLAYVVLNKGKSDIYLYDFLTKTASQLASFDGLSLNPVFSPDGNTILFSITSEGATNIFSYNLIDNNLKQLTRSYAINLAGNFSQDGKKIIFNSDRLGAPGIYSMDLAGKNVQQISQGSGGYYTPLFSPDRDIVLFTNLQGSNFKLGVLSLDGVEKIVSQDRLVESPNWVNGRTIVYQYAYKYDQDNKPMYSFYLLDIISGTKIKVKPSDNSEDPSYSHGSIGINYIQRKKYIVPTLDIVPSAILYFSLGSINTLEDNSSLEDNVDLRKILLYLKSNPDTMVELSGYSDDKEERDNEDSSTNLAEYRVKNLYQFLVSHNVPSDSIETSSYKGNVNKSDMADSQKNNAYVILNLSKKRSY